MENGKSSRLELIESIKESLPQNTTSIVGPSYHSMNKLLADLYFGVDQELKGIYHLTEAHAATLRQQTVVTFDYKKDQIENQSKRNKLPVAQGLQKEFVDFGSDIALKEEAGLLSRLRDMPKEWTVVQLTRQCDPSATFTVRPKDSVVKPSNIFIVRLPCGAALDEAAPVGLLVGAPPVTEGMPTVFDLIEKAKEEHLRTKQTVAREIRKAREMASQNIKEVVEELSSRYLKEWRCLLLGTLCRKDYSDEVNSCIDRVVSSPNHKSCDVDSRSRQLLYRVADGAMHLTKSEIQSAVACLVHCERLAADLVHAIGAFKNALRAMAVARRQPVILILDEDLDGLPWEIMTILKKHPVSRMPSIHFLHALYNEHKDHIVDGCRLVDRLDVGFYIVNPDSDLKDMESRLMAFLEKRMPNWKGVKGSSPTQEEFCSALVDHNIFLYCGHFNGSHFLGPDDVCSLRVVALPLLFGCRSIALQQLGGRTLPSGISDKYTMAGSACTIGMLWTVTSDDTDCMTVILLNSWLPGQPIDLTSFRSSGDMLQPAKELELLRLLRYARETAHLFSNSAALVARGIPIKMKEE